MGVLRNLLDRFRNRDLKQLEEPTKITTIQFPTNDGGNASLNGIKEITEVLMTNGNTTKLYSATLLKGTSDLGSSDRVCFELPSNMPLEQARDYIAYVVSMRYQNIPTTGRNESYYHMGVVNYDENGQLQMYEPSQNVLDWVNKELNEPLRKNRQQSIAQNEESKQKRREQQRLANEAVHARNVAEREKEYTEKINRWNDPIFEQGKDCHGNIEYTFYQQPDFEDRSQFSGFTTLKEVTPAFQGPLQHGDGGIGYVYSAKIFNHIDENEAESFANVYPKVCFELPYPIERMEQRLQMEDKSVVQAFGKMMRDRNLSQYSLKPNGEQTWVGRIAMNGQGQYYIDNAISAPVRDYINRENDVVRRMNMPRNNYQPGSEKGDKEQY